MIGFHTNIRIVDNSGARLVQCIKVLGGSKRRSASVGDVVVVTVKKASVRGKIKKGDVCKVLVISTNKEISRRDGIYISTMENTGIVLDQSLQPIGTRMISPAYRELRNTRFSKVLAISPSII
jgi:large subunit ribosomal protein L14